MVTVPIQEPSGPWAESSCLASAAVGLRSAAVAPRTPARFSTWRRVDRRSVMFRPSFRKRPPCGRLPYLSLPCELAKPPPYSRQAFLALLETCPCLLCTTDDAQHGLVK